MRWSCSIDLEEKESIVHNQGILVFLVYCNRIDDNTHQSKSSRNDSCFLVANY